MISIESIAYIERLLASRQIQDYYLDIFTLVIPPDKLRMTTDANRGYYYLLTHELPQGVQIASETSVLQVDDSWAAKTITKIQEFSGQMSFKLPDLGVVSQLEFVRAIPRA
jgi:hypothetical protein